MKILLVDDNADHRELMGAALLEASPDTIIEEAASGATALQLLEAGLDSYDLILLDYSLPGNDGLEILHQINKNESPPPVVVVTGRGDEEIAVQVMKAGAYDYMVKGNDYLTRIPVIAQRAVEAHNLKFEQHQAEMDLLISETRYRDIFEGVQDAILVESPDGEILDVNERACQIFGYTREDFLGKHVNELVPPEIDPVLISEIGVENLPDHPFETVNIRANGEEFPVEFTGRSHKFGDEEVLLVVLRDITDRKKAEKKLERDKQQFEALYKTALDLAGERDLNILLDTILGRVKELFQTDVAGIYLYDPEKDEVEMSAVSGYDVNVGTRLQMGEGAAGRVAQSLEPLIVEDYRTWEGRSHKYEHVPFTSVLEVPMMYAGELIGVLGINELAPKIHIFTEDDARLLSLLASSAAGAVRNARQFQAAHRRSEQLASLHRIDQAISSSLDLRVTLNVLLGHVTQQLEVDAATVLLYQPELQSLEFVSGQGFRTQVIQATNLRRGQGHAGRVAQERRVIQVSDLKQEHTGFLRSPDFLAEGFVSYVGVPLIAKGVVTGVLEIYHRQSLNPDSEWMTFLETLAGQAAIAIDNINLFNNLQLSNAEIIQAYDATIEGWAQALEMRDMETEGHSRRVVETTLKLARKMGIEGDKLVHIRRGAQLHDIGKMGVHDSILQKPGKLTDEEWEIMRQHPVYAFDWLSSIKYLRPALDIPYCHHEKWDGTGYPRGLKGEEIPPSARIFAVVDVWDALRSDRPYRKAWSFEKTLAYIEEQSGAHFDPKVVDAFTKLIKDNPDFDKLG